MSLLDNLLAFYKLDETDAADRLDASNSGPHFVINSGTPKRVAAVVGDGVGCNTFGGSDASSHLYTSSSSDSNYFDLQTVGTMSMSIWVRFGALGSPGIISNWANGGGVVQFLVWYNGSRLAFRVRSSVGVDTEVAANTFGAISTGVWYHMVVTRNASTGQIRIKVNDTAWDTAAGPTTLITGTNQIRLGSRNTATAVLNGGLDAFGFWNKIVSDAEATELYNSGNGLEYSFGISLGGNSMFVMG